MKRGCRTGKAEASARGPLKYLGDVKAWGHLVIAAAAVLIALAVAASASANRDPQPRHLEFRRPTSRASIYLGEHDGYEFDVSFSEPDIAVLYAGELDQETQASAYTAYGAHFTGSLIGGRVQARFGAIGSIAVRFVANGKVRQGKRAKNCRGLRPRGEEGHFVGRISLLGEDHYFRISLARAEGYRSRTFRLRCRVEHQANPRPSISLREAVAPEITFAYGSSGGSLALLEAGAREGHRQVALRAAHMQGEPPGAEVEAVEFEYQGAMPVGRGALAAIHQPGTLLTSLPGEHPPTATLKPAAPFVGEANYIASSPLSHSWTGDLAVQFPGLLQPLAGAHFYSALCVVSPLRDRDGCDFVPPDWEEAE